MLFDTLIQRYRQTRKAKFLASPVRFGDEFAFIGVGMHSLQNLYPVLQQLGIRLRWIHSRTLTNATAVAERFQGAKGTGNLDDILKDPKVKHVFICAHHSVQQEILSKCISAGKNCWVEKPVAKNSAELLILIELQVRHNVTVVAGHQKRCAPCYQKLQGRMGKPQTYMLSYLTGVYPEGDALSDIFIHPLDLAVFLFGPVTKLQAEAKGEKGQQAIFAILKHENGVLGNLELSSASDWRNSKETLKVDCDNGKYESENFRSLRFSRRGKKLMGIPLEKILDSAIEEKILFSASGFLPEFNHNEIFLGGYYGSLLDFAVAVSSGDKSIQPQPKDLLPTFKLMDQLREIVK